MSLAETRRLQHLLAVISISALLAIGVSCSAGKKDDRSADPCVTSSDCQSGACDDGVCVDDGSDVDAGDDSSSPSDSSSDGDEVALEDGRGDDSSSDPIDGRDDQADDPADDSTADIDGDTDDDAEDDVDDGPCPDGSDLNACGGCEDLHNDNEPGDECGSCASGFWTCDGLDLLVCVGDGLNACGGCDGLDGELGGGCGECGVYVCDPDDDDALVCIEQLNECGGCAVFEDEVGDDCGACRDGTFICDEGDPDRLVCEGASELNACGGCEELIAELHSRCGLCGGGVYVCDGGDESGNTLLCVGADPPNVCGGCEALDHRVGDSCGACGEGAYQCDDNDHNSLACVGDRALNPCGGCEPLSDYGQPCGTDGAWGCDSADYDALVCVERLNECGGVGALTHELNTECGPCGGGSYQCDPANTGAVICVNARPVNGCGGCAELGDSPNTPCGECGTGVFQCDGREAIVCIGGGMNECGGCAELDAVEGDSCGDCGQLACDPDDPDALSCVDDGYNACGGCQLLSGAIGDACGDGSCGDLDCDGVDELACFNDDGLNACDACGELDNAPGESCGGACGVWTCSQDGASTECVDTGLNACSGCSILDHEPGDVCRGCAGMSCEYACDGEGSLDCVEVPLEGFVRIEPGAFMMGSPEGEVGRDRYSEEQRYTVLTYPFYMQTKEVTQGQFFDLVGANPSCFQNPSLAWRYDENYCDLVSNGNPFAPVESVTFYEALYYANALSESESLEPCYELLDCQGTAGEDLRCGGVIVTAPDQNPYLCEGYRLPTEAEWEYSARGGTETATWIGNLHRTDCAEGVAEAVGWYCGNSNSRTNGGGMRAVNPFGVYDMLGNVSERVWDRYYDLYNDQYRNPLGPSEGGQRVVRGGSWAHEALMLRAASRQSAGPNTRGLGIGFRLARSELCPGGVMNSCGGCQPLADLGEPCGDAGQYVCHPESSDLVICDEDLNGCGELAELSHEVGAACGLCGSGAWQCDDDGRSVFCDDPGFNDCGGCEPLEHNPGDYCECDDLSCQYVCDGDDEVRCASVPLAGFVRIAPGSFMMGSPEDELGRQEREAQRPTTITRAFYMSEMPATHGQVAELLGRGRVCSRDHEHDLDGPVHSCYWTATSEPNKPAINLSWWDMLNYANQLSLREGLPMCYTISGCEFGLTHRSLSCESVEVNAPGGNPYLCEGYRLPTEAEWEFAARGGTTTATYAGDLTSKNCNDQTLPLIAWFCGNSDGQTQRVGQLQPNNYGLYDMLGNAAERVWDFYDSVYNDEPVDPLGPSEGEQVVQRGGYASTNGILVRAAARDFRYRSTPLPNVGFRLVRTEHCRGTFVNLCGGCEPLPDLGEPCGSSGHYVCHPGDSDAMICDEDLNECGGLGSLAHEVGAECGECGGGSYQCDLLDPTKNSLVCDSATPLNSCGGCEILDSEAGEYCRDCDSISCKYECDDEGALVCQSVDLIGFERIEPGSFTMGSPVGEIGREANKEGQRATTLTQAYYMQTTPVTQGQFFELMGTNPSCFQSDDPDWRFSEDNCDRTSNANPNAPVESASFYDALLYANTLSESQALASCYILSGCGGSVGIDYRCNSFSVDTPGENPYLCEGYRLPTEAEWEFAARAGTETATYAGDLTTDDCYDPILPGISWFCGNAGERTHEVGLLEPNDFGLYDMLGNVWEYVWDRFAAEYEDQPVDPTGPSTGTTRASRGGDYDKTGIHVRAAARNERQLHAHNRILGFRLVRSEL